MFIVKIAKGETSSEVKNDPLAAAAAAKLVLQEGYSLIDSTKVNCLKYVEVDDKNKEFRKTLYKSIRD
jgi:hypothetical protein